MTPPDASSHRTWRRLGHAYLAAITVTLLALGAEVALAARRFLDRRAAEAHRAANVFEKGREVLEGREESLWLHPGVRYRPGARLALDVAGERFEIAINSLGYRSREFQARKPPGTVRVICIGGSTTVQGRTNDETYPARLERKLQARFPGRPIEVLNLGINGTASDYWLARLEELLGYEPDVVVQYDFVNDLFFRDLPRYAAEHPAWTSARRSLLVARLAPPDAGSLTPYWRRTIRNLRQMSAETGAHGVVHVTGTFAGPRADTASASFRSYLDLNVESWGGRHGLRDYESYERVLREYDCDLRRVAGEGRLLLAPVDERLGDASLFIDLCHMTPAGIDALADAFLPLVAASIEELHRK